MAEPGTNGALEGDQLGLCSLIGSRKVLETVLAKGISSLEGFAAVVTQVRASLTVNVSDVPREVRLLVGSKVAIRAGKRRLAIAGRMSTHMSLETVQPVRFVRTLVTITDYRLVGYAHTRILITLRLSRLHNQK